MRHLRKYARFWGEHVRGLGPSLRFWGNYPVLWRSSRRVSAGEWRAAVDVEEPRRCARLDVDLGRPVRLVVPRRMDAYTTFEEIFILEDYRLRARLGPVRCLVDLGANFGLATGYFASLFPLERVLAVEPNPLCHRVLRRNLACRPGLRADLVGALVGDADDTQGTLAMSRNFVLARAADVTMDGRPTTKVVRGLRRARLSTLLREHGLASVDLLKLDVEFGEYALTETDGEALRACRCIVAEIHGKEDRRRELRDAWTRLGFEVLPGRHVTEDHEVVEAHRR